MSPNPRFLEMVRKWANDSPPSEADGDPLVALIAGGESETVEFKTKLPPNDIVAKNLVAFANAKGGVLLIGVGDDGKPIGLADDDVAVTMKRLQRITERLLPYPVEIGKVDLAGRTVIYVALEAAPSELRPITTSRGKYFQRQGTAAIWGTLDSTFLGEERRYNFGKMLSRTLTAFVAMSFREEEEPSLVDYFRAMERAASSTGLPINVTRMDLEEGDYEISQEIMEKIDESDIVIADFTLSSRNVYFELGYARGVKRRVIQTARKGTSLEFDIRNWRTIFYRNATELEEKLGSALKSAYADIIEGKPQQAN